MPVSITVTTKRTFFIYEKHLCRLLRWLRHKDDDDRYAGSLCPLAGSYSVIMRTAVLLTMKSSYCDRILEITFAAYLFYFFKKTPHLCHDYSYTTDIQGLFI